MSRGINRALLSGKVIGKPLFDQTGNNRAAGSFLLLSERHTPSNIISVRTKINVYGDGLVGLCRVKIVTGAYVIVDGELMNRDGQHGELLEVRAISLVFPSEEPHDAD